MWPWNSEFLAEAGVLVVGERKTVGYLLDFR
jgi:hypothetical protein